MVNHVQNSRDAGLEVRADDTAVLAFRAIRDVSATGEEEVETTNGIVSLANAPQARRQLDH